MILKEIFIKHFRSFQDEHLVLEPVTALIGPNGSGKSNIIHALNFFYTNAYKLTPECFFARVTAQPFSVTLVFGELSAEERERFAPYIDKDLLAITREAAWSEAGTGSARYFGNRLQCPDFDAIRALSGATEKKGALNDLVARGEHPGLEKVTKGADVDPAIAKWEHEHEDRCARQRDDGQFFGFTSVGFGRIDQFSKWIFIQAVRDVTCPRL